MALNFRTVTNLEEAEKLWQTLCPQETIFDSWNYRCSFQKYRKNELHFIVGEVAGEVLGVWPLQVGQNSILEFFGGDYMEDNRLLLATDAESKWPTVVTDFYNHLKTIGQPVYLQYLKNTDSFTTALPIKDDKFTLSLTNYKTYEDYLEGKYIDHKESKKTLYKKMNRIKEENIRIEKGNLAHIELLFEFINKSYGDNSSFNCRPFHKEIFRSHLTLPEFQPEFLTFYHNEKIVAVSLAFLYHGCYAYVNTGIDPDTAPKDFSVFVNLQNIQNAIDSGAKVFDCFTGSYGWKERWYLDKTPQYVFKYPEDVEYNAE